MVVLNAGTYLIPIQTPLVTLKDLNAPLLGVLPKWQTADKFLKWNANMGGATAVGEAITADVTTFSDEVIKPASLPIADFRIRHSFHINEVDYTQAAARGQEELANLITLSSAGARRVIFQTLAQKLISGTYVAADGGVIGLNTEAGATTANAGTPGKQTTTNTYAALTPATDPLWTNLVYDNFGTLSKKKLRDFEVDLMQGQTTGVMGNYNAIGMSPATATKYGEIFDATYDRAVVNSNPANGVVDLSFGTFVYNGRPILEDVHIPDGEMHFLDLNEIRLYSYNQTEAPGFSSERPIDGMLLYMKELPSDNPQDLKFAMFGMFQLQVRARRAHSVIKGITL